ncbi:MAG TPA: hypothetical protein VF120_09480 [Ktedonobacterales bacterium]
MQDMQTGETDQRQAQPETPGRSHRADEPERERRLHVLHELAQQARPLERPAATQVPTRVAAPEIEPEPTRPGLTLSPERRALWARARNQRLLRVGIFVLLVALVAGTVFALQGANPFARFGAASRPTATVAATPLAINPSAGGVDCLFDATWAPQGTSIAAIGSGRCFQGPNMLTIFDARSGKVQRQINLDTVATPVVAQTLGVPANALGIYYQQVLWSLKGSIAVLFAGVAFSQGSTIGAAEGLVLTDSSGVSTQAFALSLPTIDPPTYEVWDLTSDKGTITADSITGTQSGVDTVYATVKPALQYNWDPSGSLYYAQSLPDPRDPTAATTQLAVPVGNPTTGRFSIWQHGDLGLTQGGASTLPTWFTSYGAWAPDGSRIIDSIDLFAVLQPLGQTSLDASALNGTNFANAPLLLVRDAGMQAVLAALQTDVASTNAVQIAWRPDGKVLATQSVASTGGPVRNHEVTLYDCAKGKVLVTLASPPSRGSAQTVGGPLLRWSPDGTHLLLFDPALHVIAIWGPSMLPTK